MCTGEQTVYAVVFQPAEVQAIAWRRMNDERIRESPSWSNPRGQVMSGDVAAEGVRVGLKRIGDQLG